MKPLDCVTVGLAINDNDTHLLQYARMLAGLGIGKTFRFVHVATKLDRPDGVDGPELIQRMRTEVARHFDDSAARVQCTFDVREGECIDQMLSHLEHHPTDVVLVGHRIPNGGRRSLATRLAMLSPASVWMIPHGVPCQIGRVLAPVDFSAHSADSLSLATRLAQLAGLPECLALHVFFHSPRPAYEEVVIADKHREERAYEQFISPLELHDVLVRPIFEEESQVTPAILRVARDRQCDLIVMSTRGRSTAASVLLGSETSLTLKQSSVPVLAMKHRGAFLNLFQVLQDQKLWSRSNTKSN